MSQHCRFCYDEAYYAGFMKHGLECTEALYVSCENHIQDLIEFCVASPLGKMKPKWRWEWRIIRRDGKS